MKTLLLISNRLMHYRVSVYNYFHRRFREEGWDFQVMTNEVQGSNRVTPVFPLEVLPFRFPLYRHRLADRSPDAAILFLHFKDRIIWPLIPWLKWRRIPFATWTKTRNLDQADSRFRNFLFDTTMRLSDGLLLYHESLRKNVPHGHEAKAFAANNTVNFEEYPAIPETKEELRRRWEIPFEKVVLFAGRMDVDGGRKRVDHLIEIFRETEGRSAGLVIVGSGMRPDWEARMNPRTTRYLGEIQDPQNRRISELFKLADLCAIPGHVGLSINQAFHWGLPVVTEEGLHPPEINYLKPGRNGFIVPAGDLRALRERIFRLLDQDEERRAFSDCARQVIRTEASIEGMYSGFRDCVRFMTRKETEPQGN